MRRGTTPTHIFNTDIDLSDASVIYITYKQNEKTVLEKTLGDITIAPDSLTVKLTQEESLSFNAGQQIRVQIRARFEDGTAVASNIIITNTEEILKDGEI